VRRLACALLAATLALPAAADERVLEFHADIRIAQSGELTVTETIVVQVEGREIKRGILRDFPTDYRDRTGARVRVPFDVLRVARNGAAEPYALERLGNGVRIRIGDRSVLLRRGRHEYEITYRTARQLGFFERHDELYWNVNGNGWTFAMDRVSADVVLPVAAGAERIRAEAYTGYQGDRGRDYVAETRADGASFRTTRVLAPRQGLTVVVEFPKGIVREPAFAERLAWWIGDNRGALTGAAGFVLLIAFLLWRWHLVGRDPRAGPAFPRYEAPPGIGPAGVRFIDRMKYDNACFAAGMLGLGARGFLRIRQAGERYRIERTGKANADLMPGDEAIAALVPEGGAAVSLDRTHDPQVEQAVKSHRVLLTALFEERMFSRNRGSHFAGVGLSIATIGAMLLQDTAIALVGAAGVAMIVVLAAFAFWLPAYSVQGRKLQDAIQGLRQYLGVAEKDDLARMKAPPQTAEEFAKFLPYAVALGVEKTWADRFVATLGAAAVAAAVADYYSSTGGMTFGGEGLGASIGGMAGTVSSASTPPGSSSGGSSGGGGGGSSGGGGGGGGGSGW
jgi:hypothetical protein